MIRIVAVLVLKHQFKKIESRGKYPAPLTTRGRTSVQVGGLRQSLVFDSRLDLFVRWDQLLRGAALNALLIVEKNVPLMV